MKQEEIRDWYKNLDGPFKDICEAFKKAASERIELDRKIRSGNTKLILHYNIKRVEELSLKVDIYEMTGAVKMRFPPITLTNFLENQVK